MRTIPASARFSSRFCLVVILCSSLVFGQALKEIAKFDLPGAPGKRFDYLTIDEDDQYLISANLGAAQTSV